MAYNCVNVNDKLERLTSLDIADAFTTNDDIILIGQKRCQSKRKYSTFCEPSQKTWNSSFCILEMLFFVRLRLFQKMKRRLKVR